MNRRNRSKDMSKNKIAVIPKRNMKHLATLNGPSSNFPLKRGDEAIKAEMIRDLKESSTDLGT